MDKSKIYRRLLSYLKPYRKQVTTAYGALAIAIVFQLAVPQFIKSAINAGVESGEFTPILKAGGLILLIALLRGFIAYAEFFTGLWLSQQVAYDLRAQYYAAIQRLSFTFHDKAHTGDLMSRATSDTAQTERFVGIGLVDLAGATGMIVGVVVAMLLENWRLALISLIPVPVLAVAAIRFGTTIRPMFNQIQKQIGVLSTRMQESLTGIQMVKAFAREPFELSKFDHENDIWFHKRQAVIQQWAINWPLFSFLVACSTFLLLWFGGPLALSGTVSIGSLFAMFSYILMIQNPVQRLGFLVNMITTAGAGAGRVFEILDTPNEVADRADAVRLPQVEGRVRFEHVSFGYQEDRLVLRDVSFSAEPGEIVALIGPTGSGKSTITNLLPRFYEPTDGQISVDGHDIRSVQIASLRAHVGIVLQDPFLFSSTIAENIAYGNPDASEAEIKAAAKAAHAHAFIQTFPDGYHTRVGERGVTLSGGQKQRIAIARALLSDPRILILDDSTSSVDSETEHIIQQALAVLMAGRTTFIIAQRLLTLKKADKILVLDQGEIVERGTHDQLLAKNGLYREIYDLQLKDQEQFAETMRAGSGGMS